MQLIDLRDPKNRGVLMFTLAVVSVIGAFFLLIFGMSDDQVVDPDPEYVPQIREVDKSSDEELTLYDNGNGTKTVVVEVESDYSSDEALELFDLVGEEDDVDFYLKKDNFDYSEYADEEINYEEWGLDPNYSDEYDH